MNGSMVPSGLLLPWLAVVRPWLGHSYEAAAANAAALAVIPTTISQSFDFKIGDLSYLQHLKDTLTQKPNAFSKSTVSQIDRITSAFKASSDV